MKTKCKERRLSLKRKCFDRMLVKSALNDVLDVMSEATLLPNKRTILLEQSVMFSTSLFYFFSIVENC